MSAVAAEMTAPAPDADSTRPLRVVIATAFGVDPASPRGGVESVSANLVRALAREPDLDIHVVTMDPAVVTPTETTWRGATVHRLPRTGAYMLTSTRGADRARLISHIERLRPDVVHAHDVYGLTLAGLKVPRVMTIHGFIYKDTLVAAQRAARIRSWMWWKTETAAWARYPHLIAISPHVHEFVAAAARGVIHDIENPVDDRFFDVSHVPAPLRIFSAARLSRGKNPIALLDACARLWADGIDVELRLAGGTSDAGYARELRTRIETLGAARHVRLLGKLSASEVRRELGTASVFALASLQENAPAAVAEAMAAGLPVVTSRRCGMPYMVRDGETGFLVDPTDPAAIADRLRMLLRDPDTCERFGARAKALAIERFHPAVVARRTRHVYLTAYGASLTEARTLPGSRIPPVA